MNHRGVVKVLYGRQFRRVINYYVPRGENGVRTAGSCRLSVCILVRDVGGGTRDGPGDNGCVETEISEAQ